MFYVRLEINGILAGMNSNYEFDTKLELNLYGNPTGRSAKAPEKGIDKIPETELNSETFYDKRKQLLWRATM